MAKDERPHQSIEGDHNTQVAGNQINNWFGASRVRADSLAAVVRLLADSIDAEPPQERVQVPYDPDEKIVFNDLQRYRSFVEETALELHAVEAAYEALAQSSYPKAKVRLQRHLRSKYRSIKAAEPTLSGDDCFERILHGLKALTAQCDLSADVADWSCDYIVAHAFVECTILETPNAG